MTLHQRVTEVIGEFFANSDIGLLVTETMREELASKVMDVHKEAFQFVTASGPEPEWMRKESVV